MSSIDHRKSVTPASIARAKGGAARAKALTPEQRKEISEKANAAKRERAAQREGGDRLAKFVSGDRLKPFINKHLQEVTADPIKFRIGGNLAYGYEATVLADICDAVLAARKYAVPRHVEVRHLRALHAL